MMLLLEMKGATLQNLVRCSEFRGTKGENLRIQEKGIRNEYQDTKCL